MQLLAKHMAKQVKRMRVIVEIDMDDTSAMFNRRLFNERATKWVAITLNDYFPQGAVYVSTEVVEK